MKDVKRIYNGPIIPLDSRDTLKFDIASSGFANAIHRKPSKEITAEPASNVAEAGALV